MSKHKAASTLVSPQEHKHEYLLVADCTSEVLRSDCQFETIRDLAELCRKAGGEVSVFKSIDLWFT